MAYKISIESEEGFTNEDATKIEDFFMELLDCRLQKYLCKREDSNFAVRELGQGKTQMTWTFADPKAAPEKPATNKWSYRNVTSL